MLIGLIRLLRRARAVAAMALCVASLCAASIAAAQAPQAAASAPAGPPVSVCGQDVPAPRAAPPTNIGPVLYLIAPCFEAQDHQSVIDVQTYLYYIQVKPSQPSQGNWVPYNEATEAAIRSDFRRLLATNFLDNLWIDARDYTFSNGVTGKIVYYNMEERQRVKIVDYTGSKKVEVSKIEEKLKEVDAQIRLDTFIDAGLVRKVAGVVEGLMKEKGFQYATVTPDIQPVSGGPKLVHLTFKMDEGPKVKIRQVTFTGNKAMSSGSLRKQMKDNKGVGFFSFISGGGAYQEAKFDEDAEHLREYYSDRGYIAARIGVPELKFLNDSSDKKTRYIELKIPVTEGNRYKTGDVTFEGNTVVKGELLRPMFKLPANAYYSEKEVRKGLEKAREAYGAGGYFEFTGYPDLKPRDVPNPADPQAPAALQAPEAAPVGPPIVDVVMRIQEGKQYFVNRITFLGNTTTRDNVIRREVRLVENGIFNTEALKLSVKRLNQLGYFKPLEGGRDVDIQKTAGVDNKVDVTLKLEEQNRNQLSFGAGISEFEGVFGQFSFQTSNFLGRGESLTLSVQTGSRAHNYSLGFTEPFLFDRNITGGLNVFRSEVRYVSQFTQRSTGSVVTFGFPLADFTRMFANYSYERVRVTEVSATYTDPILLARNPFLRDSLLIGEGGERIISKVVPSIVHNTVDNPITPTTGRRLTASVDLAGLGGNTNFYKPTLEGVWYLRQNSRMSLGMRGQVQYVNTFTGSKALPIFEKIFLGGEYSVRGYEIRSIGPSDPQSGLVLGGNKSLLFNVEELITIAGPVRAVLFYDAGQVQPGQEIIGPAPFVPDGQFYGSTIQAARSFNLKDFKTSTGLEIRFFMPVLNVPFRLIFAYNPQRSGVLDSVLQPQKAFQFRFAVGSTF